MELHDTIPSPEGIKVSEPQKDYEMNNLESNLTANPDTLAVSGNTNTENTPAQAETVLGDSQKQNGNCETITDLQKTENTPAQAETVLGDSQKQNGNCETITDLQKTENTPAQAETVLGDSQKQNGNCETITDLQKTEDTPARVETVSGDSEKQNCNCETITDLQKTENTPAQAETASGDSEKQNCNCETITDVPKINRPPENLIGDIPPTCITNPKPNLHSEKKADGEKLSEAIVKINKPLCADYRSDSDSESCDSESDSSQSSSDTMTESSSDSEDDSDDSSSSVTNNNTSRLEGKKSKKESFIYDLPPIEDLRISVPEDDCVEIGTITSIVDTLVVVESYKGSAALDVDTVLFLDNGKRTLGKVFDILGPVAEPVYAVRFNSHEQIKNLNIEKGLKVYYAPKTPHTTYVFMSEVLKNRGSDASWKDNVEAPSEFQDFSDDEEERVHRQQLKEADGEYSSLRDQKSRKRPFTQFKPSRSPQPNSFRNPNFLPTRRPNFQRYPQPNPHTHPFPRPNIVSPYPYNAALYRGPTAPVGPPHMYFPPPMTGPPFPTFGGLPFFHQNFQQPYYQQRTHPPNFGAWGNLTFRPPPPPPPPATDKGTHTPANPDS